MPIERTEAVVLRTLEWSETSLIAWLLTPEHGRVHVVAKGARRPRSPFEGALEPLVRGELVFYRKRKDGDGLETAKEFDPLDRHAGLRHDLARLYRAQYLAELATELSERDAPAPEPFQALVTGLAGLAHAEPSELELVLLRTELALIAAAGLAPCLESCTRCGAALPEAWFSPAAGGVLCAVHAGQEPAARISPGVRKTLLVLAAGGQVGVDRNLAMEIRDLLDRFLEHHLGKRLRLAPYLRSSAGRPPGGRPGRPSPGQGSRAPATPTGGRRG